MAEDKETTKNDAGSGGGGGGGKGGEGAVSAADRGGRDKGNEAAGKRDVPRDRPRDRSTDQSREEPGNRGGGGAPGGREALPSYRYSTPASTRHHFRYAPQDDSMEDDEVVAAWREGLESPVVTSTTSQSATASSSATPVTSSLGLPRGSSYRTPSPVLSVAGTAPESLRSPSPQHRFEMSTTGTSGVKLAQEIHDEFLVCKICLEVYTNPKSLNCLHTFCEQCIENHVMSESTYKKYSDYREFTCPLCRKRTQLPIGGVKKLPDNFLVSSLSEVVGRQRPSKFPFCDICKMVNRKHREASSKCLDCAKLLCKGCVDLHRQTKVTKNHSIFDVEIEKDIECKEHDEEVVRFYCEPCETCICVLCTFNEHKDHEISQFGEAVTKYKGNIQKRLESCKEKVAKFDSQIDQLNKAEQLIKQTEQRIHETAIQFISDIRGREKQLIEELQNLYGKDMMGQLDSLKDMTSQVDGLRSTCNLTEVILKGKDIELLLLKKDVQEKLDSLGAVTICNLPATISKQVNFLPGEIDLGCIQDMDRPMLTKMRAKKISGDVSATGKKDGPPSMEEIVFKDQTTQTDAPEKKQPVKKKITRGGGDSDSDTESESEDSDDDDDDESDSESEDEKPETVEKGVQTEPPPPPAPSSCSDKGPGEKTEMIDQCIYTDEICTEEKGVNTRSRSLQNAGAGAKDANEDSLAARRRRRRERAQYASQGGGSFSSFDEETDKRAAPGSGSSNRLSYRGSIDNDDMFYEVGEQSTAY